MAGEIQYWECLAGEVQYWEYWTILGVLNLGGRAVLFISVSVGLHGFSIGPYQEYWTILGVLGHIESIEPFWAISGVLGRIGSIGPYREYWAVLGVLGFFGSIGLYWKYWSILPYWEHCYYLHNVPHIHLFTRTHTSGGVGGAAMQGDNLLTGSGLEFSVLLVFMARV